MSQSSHDRLVPHVEGRINTVLRVALYGGIGIVIIMMLLTVVHGIGRYGFDHPVPGLVELSSYMLVTMVFLIGAYTMVARRHIAIGLLVERFSERTQAIIDSATYIVCLMFAILALWQSFVRGLYLVDHGQVSAVLHIPNFPFVYMVGAGWVLLSLAIVIHLVHFLQRAVKK